MKKQELEDIFGKGRVSETDGELTVTCIHTLGFNETTALNKLCIDSDKDYKIKPSADGVFIKII